MVVERGDVNHDPADTLFRLIPTTQGAIKGHKEVIEMLLKWRVID